MPGERYLAPLALVEFEVGREWWPLTAGAQMPVEGGAVLPARWTPDISAALSGRSIEAAARAIATTRPDPVAAELRHLRPQDRVEAVARRKSQDDAEPPGRGLRQRPRLDTSERVFVFGGCGNGFTEEFALMRVNP